MIARRPTGGEVRGATPAQPLLFPVAAPAPGLSSSPQQQLLDQRYIQRLFAAGALGGLWLPEPQYLYEDSAGTTTASTNGVVGAVRDVVFGLTAVQATTANKPYLRRTPVSGKYWLDGNTATAAMTATFPSSLGSACTVALANADGVTINTAQTINTTYNLTPPYGYNSAVMVINRALTASETAVVARYLKNWVPVLEYAVPNNKFNALNTIWVPYNSLLTVDAPNETLIITGTGISNYPSAQILNLPVGSYILEATTIRGSGFSAFFQAYFNGVWQTVSSSSTQGVPVTGRAILTLFTQSGSKITCSEGTENASTASTYFKNVSITRIL